MDSHQYWATERMYICHSFKAQCGFASFASIFWCFLLVIWFHCRQITQAEMFGTEIKGRGGVLPINH